MAPRTGITEYKPTGKRIVTSRQLGGAASPHIGAVKGGSTSQRVASRTRVTGGQGTKVPLENYPRHRPGAPVGAPASPKPGTFNSKGQVGFTGQPVPENASSKVAGHAVGATQFGFKAAKSSPAITYLMIGTFVIVALAKLRGGLDALDIPKALFGGFIVAFILTLLAQAAPSLALGFALLIFVGALLELGPKALGFSLKGTTVLPKGEPGSNDINGQDNIFAQATGKTPSFAPGVYGGVNYVDHGTTYGTSAAQGNSPESVFY